MDVRLVIDEAACDGHGICLLAVPEFVELDRWGHAHRSELEIATPAQLRRARRAVRACPAGALRLVTQEASTEPSPARKDGEMIECTGGADLR